MTGRPRSSPVGTNAGNFFRGSGRERASTPAPGQPCVHWRCLIINIAERKHVVTSNNQYFEGAGARELASFHPLHVHPPLSQNLLKKTLENFPAVFFPFFFPNVGSPRRIRTSTARRSRGRGQAPQTSSDSAPPSRPLRLHRASVCYCYLKCFHSNKNTIIHPVPAAQPELAATAHSAESGSQGRGI